MKSLELKFTPAEAADPEIVRARLAARLRWPAHQLQYAIRRRAIDARRGRVEVVLWIDAERGPLPPPEPPLLQSLPAPKAGPVLIVGAGPAGYFAALELLTLGIKPIVLERGKDVRARRYDLRKLMQFSEVDPHSNYCFGEGGAGTYSDGKLYTRADKRGDVRRVLRLLVECGARSEILVDTHPHIGSNKLPGVVENLRAKLLEFGAEVHFGQHVSELVLRDGRVVGVRTSAGEEFQGEALVLATGHSARDVFEMLQRQGLALEAKPFALGVRVEHPQPLIDRVQYKQDPRDPHLPAASYRLACQVDERGVYSFCMCPGGLIVPAATAPGEIVVNGMSMSGRNSRWANSGMVVEIGPSDWRGEGGPLAAMHFQAEIERRAFLANGNGTQQAPACRLVDFLERRVSPDLPRCSYVPGLVRADLYGILPDAVSVALRDGLAHFGRKMPEFLSSEAVLVGVESRTSSPVRIPRDAEALSHPQVANLFPCGEGAGYAGGILSAAMDGQRVARALTRGWVLG